MVKGDTMNTYIALTNASNLFLKFYEQVLGPEANGGYMRYNYWIKGTIFTLELTFLSAILGTLLGLTIALMKLSDKKFMNFNILKFLGTVYTDVIRGTPSVIQIMIVYMTLSTSTNLPKLIIASIAFAINSGAYVAEIVRAGILGVDKGQMEAARSLGLPYSIAMKKIVVPQAIKNILPTLVSEYIVLFKETAVVGFIAGVDITRVGYNIMSKTFTVEPLYFAAIIYLILTTSFTGIMRKVERRLRKSDSR